MDIPTIIDLATRAGPYGLAVVFFWMWKLEREERLRLQEALMRGIEVVANVNNTLQEFRSSLWNFRPADQRARNLTESQ
jgi:hypothetical protein